MKTKPKLTRSRGAVKAVRLVSVIKANGTPAAERAVVPLKERRLVFGKKWDYAPAPETSEYIKIAPRYELFINGKFVPPVAGKYFDTINPATEEKLTQIALGDEQDVDRAVKAARRAYEKGWSKMSGRERGKYIYRTARIMQEKSRELDVPDSMGG